MVIVSLWKQLAACVSESFCTVHGLCQLARSDKSATLLSVGCQKISAVGFFSISVYLQGPSQGVMLAIRPQTAELWHFPGFH